ncbi:major facilitator superfamily domain-containing protein [Chaetomium strumarium]|uniref:Probable transporter MCH1 n=1 Tax=Chaetomium strumarium TaxID=1170767 RepID=A0AAJ0GQY4_9PEZI|nr:major facilitator superfamily domain-containing protein [Chaetomium strumarium]
MSGLPKPLPIHSAMPGDESTPLLHAPAATSIVHPSPSPTPTTSRSSSVRSPSPTPRARARAQRLRVISLFSALLSSLCAGSITIFSLYGHILQTRLHYSQYQVNGLASAASIAMYVPVPLLGFLCDRSGPAPLSLLAAAAFGTGYAGAAGAFSRAESLKAGGGEAAGAEREMWYAAMVLAFVAIGVGTCSMYMSAVATCAKNFGMGKHRGLAVAGPIAAFGLSGMWLSQVGGRLFVETGGGENGPAEEGEIDVVKFFVFLSGLLVIVGVIGAFGLKIMDEKDLIEEAVEELERSGILDGSAIFTPGRAENGHGAVERSDPFDDTGDRGTKDPKEEEARLKKQWVLNAETRRFLTDHTMWCFAVGFFFMIGPGEAFINNMGTVIKTLYSPTPTLHYTGKPTSAATHVSIVGITSTAVRLLTGTLTDLLAPSPKARHVQITTPLLSRSTLQRFALSRVSFLLFFAVLLSVGLAVLASGLVQNHGERFWIVSGLVGAGYGAVFSLTPIIITVIWGVENFATNWGIVATFPALGATLWGLVYSAVYQAGTKSGGGGAGGQDDNLCYGEECYAAAFWAMAASVWIACGLVLWAWKGKNGWAQRGVVV